MTILEYLQKMAEEAKKAVIGPPKYEPIIVSPARMEWIRLVVRDASHPNHEEVIAFLRHVENGEAIVYGPTDSGGRSATPT